MGKASRRCFCAFCRSERNVYRKRHIGVVDMFLALAASALLSFIIWQDLDPRLAIFFSLGLGLAELFIVFRWRLSIVCSKCGFDPVIYRKSPEQAAERVKAHYKSRREDPLWMMAPPPSLPRIAKERSRL
ncbi:MAG TPA: hypothetical protein VM432_01720 [Bdellovibrionales bacterium]|nr:hypothetical protein [Bdellovibrionales bacterium]